MCINGLTAAFVLLLFLTWILTQRGMDAYTVLSGSMEPTLQIGDLVLIDTKDRSIENGEIIAFYMGGQVVVHRVVEVTEDGLYITKGDANETRDFTPVGEERIIGSVWASLRRLKWLWLFFTSKLRYWAVVILLILHICSDELFDANGGVVVGNH